MCYIGAKTETAKQLKDFLNLTSLSNDDILKLNNQTITFINTRLVKGVVLSTANKIYSNKALLLEKDFEEKVTQYFHSEIEKLDFSYSVKAAKTINDWVLHKTNDKIKDLIPADSLDNKTALILINAIYFKGSWEEKFDPANTTKEDFNCADGSKVKVDMMKHKGKNFKYLNVEEMGIKICQFAYTGNNVSMTIILPNENIKLGDIEKGLTEAKIKELLNIELYKEKINVYLPKFKIEFEAEV
jgi:serpin B